MKKIIFIFILLLIVNCIPEQIEIIEEEEEEELILESKYEEWMYYKTLWESKNIKNYNLELGYVSHSINAGNWSLEIRNGVCSKAIRDGIENENFKFTIDDLFELSKMYYLQEEDGGFVYDTIFNMEYGIEFSNRVENPNASFPPPSCMEYAYKINSFEVVDE